MFIEKIKKLLGKVLDFLFCDVEEIVHFICTQEALPTPLDDATELEYIQMLGTENHDLARAKLIEHNLRLVIYTAKRFKNTKIDFDDLVSIGIVGLIKAVGSFKPDKNIRLATYSSRCIENEILMYLRKISRSKNNISLEAPLSRDGEGNELLLQDILADESQSVDHDIELQSDKQLIRSAVHNLHPRAKQIISLRYGLDGEDEYTQREVADMLGISQSYISRLERKILEQLKCSMIE